MELFTHKAYHRLLTAVCQAGYQVITVREYLQGFWEAPSLVLRHDAEWDVSRTLAIADIERAHGLRSTLYFRVDTRVVDLGTMRSLQDGGFEIGYHFNTLDRCHGDFGRATLLFEQELRQLRTAGIQVDTVCSHGDPRVKKANYQVNNEIFLKDQDLRTRNGLLGEAYLDVDFSSLQYLSDAGVRWNGGSITANQLISRIEGRRWPIVYMLTHPDYWSKSVLRALGLQAASNGMRRLRINKAVVGVKGAVGPLQGLFQKKSHHA